MYIDMLPFTRTHTHTHTWNNEKQGSGEKVQFYRISSKLDTRQRDTRRVEGCKVTRNGERMRHNLKEVTLCSVSHDGDVVKWHFLLTLFGKIHPLPIYQRYTSLSFRLKYLSANTFTFHFLPLPHTPAPPFAHHAIPRSALLHLHPHHFISPFPPFFFFLFFFLFLFSTINHTRDVKNGKCYTSDLSFFFFTVSFFF